MMVEERRMTSFTDDVITSEHCVAAFYLNSRLQQVHLIVSLPSSFTSADNTKSRGQSGGSAGPMSDVSAHWTLEDTRTPQMTCLCCLIPNKFCADDMKTLPRQGRILGFQYFFRHAGHTRFCHREYSFSISFD